MSNPSEMLLFAKTKKEATKSNAVSAEEEEEGSAMAMLKGITSYLHTTITS